MEVSEMTISELQDECFLSARGAGWWDNTPGDFAVPIKVALIHSELTEVLEADRRRGADGGFAASDKIPEFSALEEEIADVIIRSLDLAGFLRLDVEGAIQAKLRYNETRHDHKKEVREASGGKRY